MVVALPFASKLVQQNQETRSKATGYCDCAAGTCKGSTCVDYTNGGATCQGTKTCTQAPPACTQSCDLGSACSGGPVYACGKICGYGNKVCGPAKKDCHPKKWTSCDGYTRKCENQTVSVDNNQDCPRDECSGGEGNSSHCGYQEPPKCDCNCAADKYTDQNCAGSCGQSCQGTMVRPTAIPTSPPACTGSCFGTTCNQLGKQTASGICTTGNYCCGESIVVVATPTIPSSSTSAHADGTACGGFNDPCSQCANGYHGTSGNQACGPAPTVVVASCDGNALYATVCTGGKYHQCLGSGWTEWLSCPSGQCNGSGCAPEIPTSTPTTLLSDMTPCTSSTCRNCQNGSFADSGSPTGNFCGGARPTAPTTTCDGKALNTTECAGTSTFNICTTIGWVSHPCASGMQCLGNHCDTAIPSPTSITPTLGVLTLNPGVTTTSTTIQPPTTVGDGTLNLGSGYSPYNQSGEDHPLSGGGECTPELKKAGKCVVDPYAVGVLGGIGVASAGGLAIAGGYTLAGALGTIIIPGGAALDAGAAVTLGQLVSPAITALGAASGIAGAITTQQACARDNTSQECLMGLAGYELGGAQQTIEALSKTATSIRSGLTVLDQAAMDSVLSTTNQGTFGSEIPIPDYSNLPYPVNGQYYRKVQVRGGQDIFDVRDYNSSARAQVYNLAQDIRNQRTGGNAQYYPRIDAVAEAVNTLLPYDYAGLNNNYVKADQYNQYSLMIKNCPGGVCRNQAPLLTQGLRDIGFADAVQVAHDWEGQNSAHTLAYIPQRQVFVNPGNPSNSRDAQIIKIPLDQYQSNAVNWRYVDQTTDKFVNGFPGKKEKSLDIFLSNLHTLIFGY